MAARLEKGTAVQLRETGQFGVVRSKATQGYVITVYEDGRARFTRRLPASAFRVLPR